MERITTPGAEIDKFGAGKNGFQANGPPNTTELSPEFFDGLQEEVSRTVEWVGEILDGGQLDQMAIAIASYIFQDPSIVGTLTVESLAAIDVASGGTLNAMAGSVVAFQGTTTISPTAIFMVDTLATFNAGLTVSTNETLTFEDTTFVVAGNDHTATYGTNAVVTYDTGAVITTGSGSTIDMVDNTSKLITGAVELDTPVSSTPDPGVLQWDGLSLTIGDGSLATGRRVPAPLDSWIPGDITTMAGNVATGATITLVVRALESIIITYESEMTNDDAVPVLAFNIEVSSVVVGGTAERQAPAPGRFVDVSRRVQYTAGVVDELAVIVAFFGASNGTTTARNILLTVRRAN